MPVEWLRSASVFRALGVPELRRLLSRCYTQTVHRGDTLIPGAQPLTALHIVISGRLAAQKNGAFHAEYGPGAVLGEIAFFTREAYAETVTAVRETLVLVLDWDEFVELASRAPEYWQAVTYALAQKIARSAPREDKRNAAPQTLAVIPAGPQPVPPGVMARIAAAFDPLADCQVLTATSYGQHMPGGLTLDDPEVMHWLKEQQQRFDLIIRIGSIEWDEWTENAVLDADEVLLVGVQGGQGSRDVPLNPVEERALAIRGVHAARLALIHTGSGPARSRPPVQPWLNTRPVRYHHRLRQDDDGDYARLARFVLGRAVGYIACGGGGAAVCHLGVMQALMDSGAAIDCTAGIGAGAMAAALIADGVTPADAARFFPLARGRTGFERTLAAVFAAADIADLAIPFRALSANMTTGDACIHATGAVAAALVANWPPPGVAQPFLNADGHHLADGALIDAVPSWLLDSVHDGANLTVKIAPPLPAGMMEGAPALTWARRLTGGASGDGRFGMAEVMLRGLGLRGGAADPAGALILAPPVASLDAPETPENQQRLYADAYEWASREFEALRASGHPLFAHNP